MSRNGVRVAAVDLGASSGRVIAGDLRAQDDGVRVSLTPAYRFSNAPVLQDGSLRWDFERLWGQILSGLGEARGTGAVDAIGVDTWAVDYGLLDAAGELLGNPYCYRDPRTKAIPDRIIERIGRERLYESTGIQLLPINTLFQVVAAQRAEELAEAASLLLMPDLIGYRLTGECGAERTNASTTQMYDPTVGDWAHGLLGELDVPANLLAVLRDPGDRVGTITGEVTAVTGLDRGTPVIAVGSHDTASAVAAVPAEGETFAYISSGTWSLVGLQLDRPILSAAARDANFTNEVGIDGTTRFLKNVMGLWVLTEFMRAWDQADMQSTLAAAEGCVATRTILDINDIRLLSPHSEADPMPARIASIAAESGEPTPRTPAEVARCIMDSLAVAYRRHVREAAVIAHRDVDVVHIVGGGSQNQLLNQLTADACGLPVIAGPVEATALGNVLVQARSLGLNGLSDLPQMRAAVRHSFTLHRYGPRAGTDWSAAEARTRR